MTPPPDDYIAHFRKHGYHPRSDKHSNALGLAIVADLIDRCGLIARHAEAGVLVYKLNHTLKVGTTDWNVDLVLGQPAEAAAIAGGGIAEQVPSTARIAIEFKAVMTEHRKAVKNRKRDLEAHHEHVHNYAATAIACGVLTVNAAERFISPLRREGDVTTHKDPSRLVEHCIAELRSVAERGGSTGYGLEAKCALVVECDNIDHSTTRYSTVGGTPAVGDPLHYDSFIQRICERYRERYG